MGRLLLVDGNSIMNRAFYGIMGNKMLSANGIHTNAVYGFLAILFKIEEDLNPDYIAVAFDLKAPTARHKMYEGYKANRHGMPDELAEQMPVIKEVLKSMNITIIEKEGYEADDVLGTLSKRGEKEGLEVTILSGDRDTFQLTSDHITVRIPRTKGGKTLEEDFDREKVIEVYGLQPEQLKDVKGLQGDTSDNIPGVPGVGEKTALSIIKEYGSIENLYKQLDEGQALSLKGKIREKIIENKELAIMSKELGSINLNVPIEEKIESLIKKEWNYTEVLKHFKNLKFNRYIERFDLENNKSSVESINTDEINNNIKINIIDITEVEDKEKESIINSLKDKIIQDKKMFYLLQKREKSDTDNIIKKEIVAFTIFNEENVYFLGRKRYFTI